jgi:general secretion pathway protein K
MFSQTKNTTRHKHQDGSAIIVALFVVALVAAIAVAMMTRIQQDTRRTELLLNSNQAYLYAQGSIIWATDQLINDWKQQKPQQLIDKTPIKSQTQTINNASVESTIYDAQGLFNLNNLADKTYQVNFSQLLKAIMPSLKPEDIQNITLATVDWVSSNAKSETFNEYYAKLTPPYHSPRHIMTSLSELRLVKGVTAELFTKLSPYIIALPTTTPISVNNAPAPVLMSLSPTLNLESAKSIEKYCVQNPFTTLQSFQNFDIVKNNSIQNDKTTITSTYFLVKTTVTIGDQSTILYTLLQREIKNSKPTVATLWQSKGTL